MIACPKPRPTSQAVNTASRDYASLLYFLIYDTKNHHEHTSSARTTLPCSDARGIWHMLRTPLNLISDRGLVMPIEGGRLSGRDAGRVKGSEGRRELVGIGDGRFERQYGFRV